MKKIVIVALVLVFGFLFFRFVIGGPEDTWICTNGEWVKHGNPKASIPTTVCEKTYELYWGEGCPHCKNVEDFITTWDKKDQVKIDKFEVQQSQVNSNKMLKRAESCGLDTTKGLGVPFLYTPDGKCLNGDTPIIDFFKAL
jgi:hypothetical protein